LPQSSAAQATPAATGNKRAPEVNVNAAHGHQMAQMPQNLAARYRADWSQWTSLQAPGNTEPLGCPNETAFLGNHNDIDVGFE